VLNSDTLELEYRFDYFMCGQFMKFIQREARRLASALGLDLRLAAVTQGGLVPR